MNSIVNFYYDFFVFHTANVVGDFRVSSDERITQSELQLELLFQRYFLFSAFSFKLEVRKEQMFITVFYFTARLALRGVSICEGISISTYVLIPSASVSSIHYLIRSLSIYIFGKSVVTLRYVLLV